MTAIERMANEIRRSDDIDWQHGEVDRVPIQDVILAADCIAWVREYAPEVSGGDFVRFYNSKGFNNDDWVALAALLPNGETG